MTNISLNRDKARKNLLQRKMNLDILIAFLSSEPNKLLICNNFNVEHHWICIACLRYLVQCMILYQPQELFYSLSLAVLMCIGRNTVTPIPSQKYDRCCPFVSRVLSFDLAVWLETFRLDFFVVLLFSILSIISIKTDCLHICRV